MKKVGAKKQVWISNFDAENWISGETSPTEIKLNLLNNGESWIACEEDKPFIIGGFCSRCPEATYYNIETQTCAACQNDLVFSNAEHKCMEVCCKTGKYYNYEEKKCMCPAAQPHETMEGHCVTCVLPDYWN